MLDGSCCVTGVASAPVSYAERLRALLQGVWDDMPGRVGFAAWHLDEHDAVLRHAERAVPAASTIKVLVLIAALRAVQAGRFGLDEDVPLPAPADRLGGFGVLRELTSVRQMSLRDLLTLMIVISDNTATNAVIDLVGHPALKHCATDIGCIRTAVHRRLADHPPAQPENLTCAADQARILHRLARAEALPADLTEYALEVLSRQQVRDRLPALLPDGASCWNKTGEQPGLRHDVGLIGSSGRPEVVIAVVVDQLADPRSRGNRGGPACEFIATLAAKAYEAL